MKRAPQAGSKAAEVRAFFSANPDEMMSHDDIMAKFGVTKPQAYRLIDRLRDEGMLKSGVLVWLDPDRPR